MGLSTKINISFDVEDIYGDQFLLNDTLFEILSFCNFNRIVVDVYVSVVRYESLKRHSALMKLCEESNYIHIGYHSNSHSFVTIPEQKSIDDLKKIEEHRFDIIAEKFTNETGGIVGFQQENKTKLFRCPGFCWTADYFEFMRLWKMRYTTIDIDYQKPFKFMNLVIVPVQMRSLEKIKSMDEFDALIQGEYKSVYLHPARLVYNHFWDKLKSNTYHILESREIYLNYSERVVFIKRLLLYIYQHYEIFSLTQIQFKKIDGITYLKEYNEIASLKEKLLNSMIDKWNWSQITGNIDRNYHVDKIKSAFTTIELGNIIIGE